MIQQRVEDGGFRGLTRDGPSIESISPKLHHDRSKKRSIHKSMYSWQSLQETVRKEIEAVPALKNADESKKSRAKSVNRLVAAV